MYCSKCGVKLLEGAKFCSACGFPCEQKAAKEEVTPTTSSIQNENVRVEDNRRPEPKNNSGCRVALIVVLAIVLLLVVITIGGCFSVSRFAYGLFF